MRFVKFINQLKCAFNFITFQLSKTYERHQNKRFSTEHTAQQR